MDNAQNLNFARAAFWSALCIQSQTLGFSKPKMGLTDVSCSDQSSGTYLCRGDGKNGISAEGVVTLEYKKPSRAMVRIEKVVTTVNGREQFPNSVFKVTDLQKHLQELTASQPQVGTQIRQEPVQKPERKPVLVQRQELAMSRLRVARVEDSRQTALPRSGQTHYEIGKPRIGCYVGKKHPGQE